VEFGIPYLYPYPWMPTVNSYANGPGNTTGPQYLGDLANQLLFPTLNIVLLSQQSPTGTFITVPFVMFSAMGSDVEFRELVYNVPTYKAALSKEKMKSSAPMRKKRDRRNSTTLIAQGILDDFSKEFETLGIPGATLTSREPGDVYTFRDLISHWSTRQPTNLSYGPSYSPNVPTAYPTGLYLNGLFDFITSMFVFNRLSMRYRLRMDTADTTEVSVRLGTWSDIVFQGTIEPAPTFTPDSGYARVIGSFDPLLEFEVPFRCLSEMVTPWSADSPQSVGFFVETDTDASPTFTAAAVCAGRDSELSHLSYLPPTSAWMNSG